MNDLTAILAESERLFGQKFPSVESYSQRSGDYTETPLPALRAFVRERQTLAYEAALGHVREVVEGLFTYYDGNKINKSELLAALPSDGSTAEGGGNNRDMNREPNQTSFKKGHKKVGGFVVGSHHTDEAKEKVRQSLLGRRGSLARNWQGGKTAMNTIIRYSTESKQWRQAIFERDDYTCQGCGARSGNGVAVVLHADHIKPFAYFPELRFELTNGRTLCRECHKKTPTYAGRAVKLYA